MRNGEPDSFLDRPIMDAYEAAAYLRTTTSTLAKYRSYGGGPVFCRQSTRKILYRKTDLDAWLDGSARSSTSDPGPSGAPLTVRPAYVGKPRGRPRNVRIRPGPGAPQPKRRGRPPKVRTVEEMSDEELLSRTAAQS